MNDYYLYYHYTADTHRLFYIGKGKGQRAYTKYRRNAFWKNIVNKHGVVVEIIQSNISDIEAKMLEIDMIALHRKMGYVLANISDGGEGTSGIKLSEEIKQQKRAYKHTAEAKKRISDALIGNKHKIGKPAWNSGKIWSDETRHKISVAKTGAKYPNRKKLSSEDKTKISERAKILQARRTRNEYGQYTK